MSLAAMPSSTPAQLSTPVFFYKPLSVHAILSVFAAALESPVLLLIYFDDLRPVHNLNYIAEAGFLFWFLHHAVVVCEFILLCYPADC